MKTKNLFSKEVDNITLTATERELLRARIQSYMEYHPLHTRSILQRSAFWRAPQVFLRMHMHTMKFASAFLLLLFISVPLLAEHALPGDTLYSVKVRFNEEVRSQLLFSPYQKIQWEAERVGRRVAEAQSLIREGKLTKANEDTLEETVRSHTATLQAQLSELRKTDAAGTVLAEATLGSTLDAQSLMLHTEIGQEASSSPKNEGGVAIIATIVQEARAGVGVPADTGLGSTTPAYTELVSQIAEQNTQVQMLLQGLSTRLSDVQNAEIQEHILAISVLTTRIEALVGAGDADRATTSLSRTLIETKDLVALLSSVTQKVDIALDPVVLQKIIDALLTIEIQQRLTLFESKKGALDTYAERASGENKTELLATLQTLQQDIDRIHTQLTAGKLVEALQGAGEADTLISSLEAQKTTGAGRP